MLKRVFVILASVCLLFCVSAAMADVIKGEPFELVIEDNVVKGYKGDPGEAPADLIIPEGVTWIYRGVFSYEEYVMESPDATSGQWCSPVIKSVTLPSTISMVDSAFEELESLVSVTFKGGREISADRAFEDCKNLTTVLFPSTLRRLSADEMCLGCSSLKKVVLPETLAQLSASSMFKNCIALTEFNFPSGLEAVSWDSMFYGCKVLKSISIPACADHIDSYAFAGCTMLTTADLSKVEYIHMGAFQDCSNLTSVVYGGNGISRSAFKNCSSLSSLKLSRPITVSDNAFQNCNNLHSFNMPVKEVGSEAFMNSGLDSVVIQPNTSIGYDAFLGTSVHIKGYENSAAENYAKKYGHPFTAITISMDVEPVVANDNLSVHYKYTEDGESFINAYTLEMEYKGKTIGHSYYMQEMRSTEYGIQLNGMKLKEGKTYSFTVKAVIEENGGTKAILGKVKLEYPFYGELPDTYSDENGKYKITNGVVSYSGTSDSSATNVVIPDKINIKGAKIPVVSISDNAFKGMSQLNSVTIGKNVTKIGKNAFLNCKSLKTIKGMANVQIIGAAAFKNCSALTAITLESKVKSIGKSAFFGCKKLKKITIKSKILTEKSIGSKAFKGTPSNATVKCPSGMKASYKTVFIQKGISKKAKFK